MKRDFFISCYDGFFIKYFEMKVYCYFSLLLLFIAPYTISYGQTESISGYVKDSRTCEPLENTEVELIATNPFNQERLSNIPITTKTNSKGYFKIDALPKADFNLKIRFVFKEIGTRYREFFVNTCNKQSKSLELLLPEKCPYHTAENKTGICPDCNKEDTVVKIVYGEPSQDLLDKADKGKIALGGCEFDEYCQALWYCKRDKVEF